MTRLPLARKRRPGHYTGSAHIDFDFHMNTRPAQPRATEFTPVVAAGQVVCPGGDNVRIIHPAT